MATVASQTQASGTSSHMMKTTKRGRPFLKDTLDLFATLIVSLDLTTHKQFFKTFPNSFTTDEAAANLAALKFSQSNRGPDPRDPSRIVTTTTTTTFSMTRDMAKAMCQHFMDARLIENAADRSSNLFKERGVFVLTPKGLHVLERFISKNGISADSLAKVFASQPICMKLLHLERRSSDDEIIISQSVVTALFKRFAGREMNFLPESGSSADPAQEYHDRSRGIGLMDVTERSQGILGGRNPGTTTFKYCFMAVNALEWLCDFTSIVGRDEAAEMAAHFVRFGLIALVSDKRKGNDSAIIFTVRGNAPGTNTPVTGEFRCTSKAIYRITDEGRQVARWDHTNNRMQDSPNTSSANLHSNERSSLDASDATGLDHKFAKDLHSDTKMMRRISISDRLHENYEVDGRRGGAGVGHHPAKESNTDRLKYILEEPALRSLFREFLKSNYCEENLSFWLDVQDFKRKFNITSSANAAGPSGAPIALAPSNPAPPVSSATGRPVTRASPGSTPGQQALKHHEKLIEQAFVIYNTYLAHLSPMELNIDHGLRIELAEYLNDVISDLTGKAFSGRVEPEQAATLNATQLQMMIRLYDRIQTHVFRLMATDSVPKFIKTPKFLALRNWVEEYEETDTLSPANPTVPPGLDEEPEIGRAYMTISQQANEQIHRERQQTERHGKP